LERVKGIEPSS